MVIFGVMLLILFIIPYLVTFGYIVLYGDAIAASESWGAAYSIFIVFLIAAVIRNIIAGLMAILTFWNYKQFKYIYKFNSLIFCLSMLIELFINLSLLGMVPLSVQLFLILAILSVYFPMWVIFAIFNMIKLLLNLWKLFDQKFIDR